MKTLTSADITLATGETDHHRVVEIEIIFGLYEEIDCLGECPNLCSFTMINCRLQRISRLEPVAHTLTRLCLADQDLTKIDGLCLPNLRQLLLHNNQIETIENLDGVPKLQKLWLSSNRIHTIENLHMCTDLRELWLQDNKISAVGGLDQLTNLHNLALSKNRIAHFEELSKLAVLPNLCSLSLSDEHYGSNPITHESGYKVFIVNQLKQVRILDGLEVQTKDQRVADDEYMKRVLKFNDKIDAIQRDHEQEMLTIDARRNRTQSHATLLQEELLAAFKALEDLVTTGRKAVHDEHTRQHVIRAKHTTALQNKLQAIQDDYMAAVDRLVADEAASMQRTEILFDILEARALAEEEHALAVSTLQQTTPASFQHLADTTPDFRYIASLFLGPQRQDIKVLQLYKCHTTVQFEPTSVAAARSAPLFLAGPASVVHSFFASSSPLPWLTSDPTVASHLAAREEPLADHYHMLVCYCNAVQILDVHLPPLSAWTNVWHAVADQVHVAVGKQSHAVYVPPAASSSVEVTPQYYALCCVTPSTVDEAELQRLLQEDTTTDTTAEKADALLRKCNVRMQHEVDQYYRQLWDDLSPDRQRVSDDVQSLQQAMSHLRSHIQDEQDNQKAALRQLNVQKQRSRSQQQQP
ncbi:Aste57867_14594 [Aphanomyces stellatus]|uniref:Aste57867_14594 protein n=1 Tax=Aphanomyces stellatus TaxID=120398 RepID=A0A485L211_9STRA|nr:hypothetical protein As57867_014540 [Aphanomyces stellatus]VFT91413.1 Aste57867_14594 [Aphanomyces stellatus]